MLHFVQGNCNILHFAISDVFGIQCELFLCERGKLGFEYIGVDLFLKQDVATYETSPLGEPVWHACHQTLP